MRSILVIAATLVVASSMAGAAVPGHQVTSLPGWEGPLTSKMFSGILPAGESCTDQGCFKMQEYYVYIESERDPATDPLVLWTNGGPGAASLFGLFVELGPYQLSDESLATASYNKTGVPTLFRNPFAWTSFASILVINSPPPVGFSYCDPPGPSGNGTSCGAWDDNRTSHHNLEFLKSFFKNYPETRPRDFYLTGESYAGIYVPTLAREILAYNDVTPAKGRINLKGFAVGDACVGSEVNCGAEGPLSTIEFFRGHGQFSGKTDALIRKVCTEAELTSPDGHSAKCDAALDKMAGEVGGYFEYALYDECWGENDLVTSGSAAPRHTHEGAWRRLQAQAAEARRRRVGSYTPGYVCGGDGALTEWSGLARVRASLHVAPDSNFFSGDNGQGFVYQSTEKSLLPFYREVIDSGSLRVLVYVGDADPCVNSFDAERWTTSLGFKETEAWRPWTMDGGERMGGYVTRYQGSFDFLTIRGAGHMVPEYKPAAAYTAIGSWLADTPWPEYVNPSPPMKGKHVGGSKVSAREMRGKWVSDVVA